MSVDAAETQTASLPVWLREVDNALVIAPHVVVAGNVLDFYLVGNRLARSVPEALWTVLEPAGYELMIVHDRVAGLSVWPATEEARSAAAELLGIPRGDPGAALEAGLPQCLRAVQQAPERRVALAVEQASRLLANRDSPDRDTFELFRLAERLATITPAVYRPGGSLYNVCFWIAQSERDLPAGSRPRTRASASCRCRCRSRTIAGRSQPSSRAPIPASSRSSRMSARSCSATSSTARAASPSARSRRSRSSPSGTGTDSPASSTRAARTASASARARGSARTRATACAARKGCSPAACSGRTRRSGSASTSSPGASPG